MYSSSSLSSPSHVKRVKFKRNPQQKQRQPLTTEFSLLLSFNSKEFKMEGYNNSDSEDDESGVNPESTFP